LTRVPAEVYELDVLPISRVPGEESRLARGVKLADLDDHLAHERIPPSATRYGWARRHVATSQLRRPEFPARGAHRPHRMMQPRRGWGSIGP
jgi:hypothetical protein